VLELYRLKQELECKLLEDRLFVWAVLELVLIGSAGPARYGPGVQVCGVFG
jgi:hypothetical protein